MGSTAFTHDLHVVPTPGRRSRALLRLHGDVDCVAADELRRVVAAVLALDRVATVVVDLDGVTFMNCEGLSPLLMAKRHLGEKMHVRAIPHCVRRLLALTHLTTWMMPSSSHEQPAGHVRAAGPRDPGEPRLPTPARRDASETDALHPPAPTRHAEHRDAVPGQGRSRADGPDGASPASGNPSRRGPGRRPGPASA